MTSAVRRDIEREAADAPRLMVIGGERVAVAGGRRFATTDPASGRVIARTAALIRQDAEWLACIEALDSGKPLRAAKGDIETPARYFQSYAGIADKMQGDSIPQCSTARI